VRPRARRRLLALLLAVGALAACGKKGPPVAPELRVPVSPAALHGAVDERSIVVSWVAPGTRMDGTRLREVALYKLYRREEAGAGPVKSAMLSSGRVVGYDEIAVIKTAAPAPAVVRGSSVTWIDQRALSVGRRYVYVVTAEDAQGRTSAPSERLVVPFLAAPKAPRALRASPGDRRVSLTWEPPAALMDDSPVTGPLAYIVLRGGTSGALAPITPQPVAGTAFTDTAVDNDTDYRYAVRAVRVEGAVIASGETSPTVAVAPADTTPPSAPTALVAVPSGGAIRLAWNPSPEPDVAAYAVYRAGGSGELVRIATTLAGAGTVYTDRDVRAGTTYRYAVTALDRARRPNESARSNVVSVRAD
jgi:fibronectin type 3 domain-containing protein